MSLYPIPAIPAIPAVSMNPNPAMSLYPIPAIPAIPAVSMNPNPAMSPNPIPYFNLQADYGDLIKSRAGRYNPKIIEEVIQGSIDLHRNGTYDGEIIKSGEDPYDPKVIELMIQRCVDILSDVEGDDCVRPDPSKPLPEGYAMASLAYYGGKNGGPFPIGPPVIAVLMDCIGCGQGGLHWPPDCPLKGTEEYYRNLAEI